MVAANAATLPGPGHRTTIIGQSGTGKSVAGAHHLLRYREEYPSMPWIVFNPKHDALLDSIGAERLKQGEGLPKKKPKGLVFMADPVPESEDDDEWVNLLIEQALFHEDVGLYFDEGYSIPRGSKQYRRALTQGRSKKCPVITLSQRPAWLDKFAFTEASFVRAFYLADKDDRKRVQGNTQIIITDDLPEFHSHWYEVNRRKRFMFGPGPNEEEIISRFRDTLPKPKPSIWKRLTA
jgi:hypothetical protein